MSNLRRHPEKVAELLRGAASQLVAYPERAEFIAAQLENVARELDRRTMTC